jgi:hypothetical protein
MNQAKNQDSNTVQTKEKLKKKNLLVGWTIGILAIALYVFVIYFK